MSALDVQAANDFAADWDVWHKRPPSGNRLPVAAEAGEQALYEAKATEA